MISRRIGSPSVNKNGDLGYQTQNSGRKLNIYHIIYSVHYLLQEKNLILRVLEEQKAHLKKLISAPFIREGESGLISIGSIPFETELFHNFS